MMYLSGIHALNLPCELLTCGDWHQSGIQWRDLPLLESDGSIFGDYGIERNKFVPEHSESFNVANHIRALLDLLILNKYSVAQGMNNDYICNEEYDEEVFHKVSVLRKHGQWEGIDCFMGREYCAKWLSYKTREGL
jgi:hypothetical protein